MKKFNPANIRRLVFDLESLTVNFDKEAWGNFHELIRVLEERDFEIILIDNSINVTNWDKYSRLSLIQGQCEEVFKNNKSLSSQKVFWFSDNYSLQKKLSKITRNFAGSSSLTLKNSGLQLKSLLDILQIFNPSKITVNDLSKDLLKIKFSSEKMPLLIGVGGPDECGHSFFVGELVDSLQDKGLLVSALDLSQVLGTEFLKKNKIESNNSSSLWHSYGIRDWFIEDVIIPYSNGNQVYIEEPPSIIKNFDITMFPFFLAPEMILIIWGTTMFIPDFENFLNIRILLELSDKCAAARLFGLDERANFDRSFVDTYLRKEGKHYCDYLNQNNVIKKTDYRIDFNNFYSFRMKGKF